MTPRMKEKYQTQVVPSLMERFQLGNPMRLPKLEKIVLNVGLGRQLEGTKLNATAREQVIEDLMAITGQRPMMTKARKSVSNFKVRQGYEVGACVTLRGPRMWEFFDRLVSMAIPRIKDFRGLSPKSFDRQGNYAFGITEQGIFPEINMAEAKFQHGMNINFTFRNSDPEKSRAVLQELGVPFSQPGGEQRA